MLTMPRTTPVSTARCSGGRRCLCLAVIWATAPAVMSGLRRRWGRGRLGCGGPLLGSLLRHALAEDPMRSEDQDHDEEREGDEITQLIGGGDADTVEEES